MWDDRYRRPGQRIREARGISEREVRVGKEDQDEGEEVCKSSPWSSQTSLVGIKAHGSLGFSDAGSSTEVLSVVTEPNRNLSSFLEKKYKTWVQNCSQRFLRRPELSWGHLTVLGKSQKRMQYTSLNCNALQYSWITFELLSLKYSQKYVLAF